MSLDSFDSSDEEYLTELERRQRNMKTKTYLKMESLVENLKVFRQEMAGQRIPKYEQ